MSSSFDAWGQSTLICRDSSSPGRFYVAVAAKMILAQFIAEYVVDLQDPQAAASLAWSYALAPHPWTKMLIRKRRNGVAGL